MVEGKWKQFKKDPQKFMLQYFKILSNMTN